LLTISRFFLKNEKELLTAENAEFRPRSQRKAHGIIGILLQLLWGGFAPDHARFLSDLCGSSAISAVKGFFSLQFAPILIEFIRFGNQTVGGAKNFGTRAECNETMLSCAYSYS
jgi:hypothetical protein